MASTAPSRYLNAKVLDRTKRMDIRARLVVEGFLTGQHRSPYHGFAVEFASHREYTPGDDIRHIDWKVWSKTDRLYIKEYEEETNLKCTILLDVSKSMRYGEAEQWSKFDHGATAAASLAYLLQQQQDAVGLVTFHTKIDKHFPPSTHPNHLKLMLHELDQLKCDNQTEVGDVFHTLAGRIGRRGMVVIVSDLFVNPAILGDALAQFRLRNHEVIVMHVMHDDELTFPFQENTLFKGLEHDAQLHTEPRALRASYLEAVGRFLESTRKACATAGVDYLLLNTKDGLDAALAGYLSFRQKTKRRLTRR